MNHGSHQHTAGAAAGEELLPQPLGPGCLPLVPAGLRVTLSEERQFPCAATFFH
jgi:hypothetical protein